MPALHCIQDGSGQRIIIDNTKLTIMWEENIQKLWHLFREAVV